MYYIQARIQSIMFNKKVLQMISSASKIILLLKWHHHKQNQLWNFVLIGTWVFGVFIISQINP
jgi:DMSO reductase anchor subunit